MRSSTLKLELYLFTCKKDLVGSTEMLHLASILSKHTHVGNSHFFFSFSQYSNTSDLLLLNVVSLYSIWYHQKHWGSIFTCHVVKDSCQKFCKLLSWGLMKWSAMKAIIKFRKIRYDKRSSQASCCEILTVITQGDRYWCTPNIPTIRNAIWMKLAMIGAHMKPRKSKTCRSTTTSYGRKTANKLLADDSWRSVFNINKHSSTLDYIFW